MQVIHDGKAISTFLLRAGLDSVRRAPIFFQYIQWGPNDAKYMGKNIVKSIVKIGSAEFT